MLIFCNITGDARLEALLGVLPTEDETWSVCAKVSNKMMNSAFKTRNCVAKNKKLCIKNDGLSIKK